MESTPKLTPVDIQHIFEEAVRLFERADLRAALHFFRLYLRCGGNIGEANDYLRRIGERALKAGDACRTANLHHYAQAYYTLAIKSGSGPHADQAVQRLHATARIPQLRSTVPAVGPPAPAPGLVQSGPGAYTVLTSDQGPAERVWRRPHLELSRAGPLAPEDAFTAAVFADQSVPEPGETSSAIDLPGGAEFYELEVRLLASAHFRIAGPAAKPFKIDRAKIETDTVTFNVSVADAGMVQALKGQPASLCAAFFYQSRPAGRVLRELQVAGAPGPDRPAVPPESSEARGVLVIDASAKAADLNITITAQAETDNRHFWCTVQTSLLPEYSLGVTDKWHLDDVTDRVVAEFMHDFTAPGLKPIHRIARLRGAGELLFRAAPPVFREAFWKLADANAELKTIAIVSAEPHIPWELMLPYREADANRPRQVWEDPIGAKYQIGRMIRSSSIPGPQKLVLDRCYVVAPTFEGPNSLPHAQKEADFVLKQISGDPIQPADLESLDQKLKTCRSLLHFACHGEVTDTG
jgi:hypothetical protein